MAGDDKGDEEEHEARVHAAGLAEHSKKDAQLIEGKHDREDRERDEDAVALVLERLLLFALLFLCVSHGEFISKILNV